MEDQVEMQKFIKIVLVKLPEKKKPTFSKTNVLHKSIDAKRNFSQQEDQNGNILKHAQPEKEPLNRSNSVSDGKRNCSQQKDGNKQKILQREKQPLDTSENVSNVMNKEGQVSDTDTTTTMLEDIYGKKNQLVSDPSDKIKPSLSLNPTDISVNNVTNHLSECLNILSTQREASLSYNELHTSECLEEEDHVTKQRIDENELKMSKTVTNKQTSSSFSDLSRKITLNKLEKESHKDNSQFNLTEKLILNPLILKSQEKMNFQNTGSTLTMTKYPISKVKNEQTILENRIQKGKHKPRQSLEKDHQKSESTRRTRLNETGNLKS